MSLSPQSLEILLDLLEIKIGYMHIQDRDDAKELLRLRFCRQELLIMKESAGKKKEPKSASGGVKFPKQTLKALRKGNRPLE